MASPSPQSSPMPPPQVPSPMGPPQQAPSPSNTQGSPMGPPQHHPHSPTQGYQGGPPISSGGPPMSQPSQQPPPQQQNYPPLSQQIPPNMGPQVIQDGINARKSVKSKSIDWDLVTEYDRRIEDKLIKQLSIRFPSHKFIGEETVAKEGCLPQLTNDPTWIIDPIDGTTNFVHRFPHTCISLALMINKKAEIGIIYNPLMKQFFSARRHYGAFLNGKPIKTSEIRDISQSLVAMEPWLAKDPQHLTNVYSRMHALIQGTHGIRSLGTAALTLCYVAMGAVEAYHIEGIDAWDVAAGKLIIEESGGVVIDTTGCELDIMTPRVIAACNQEVAKQLVNLFKKADSEILNKNLN